MDPLSRSVAVRQGRIEPENWTPADGDWCFTLGSDQPGEMFPLVDGDYVEVSQVADFGAATGMFFSGRIRGPRTIPANSHWEFAVLVDGSERTMRRVIPGQTVDLGSMALCVADLAPGDHTLTFRLKLVVET